MIRYEMLFRCVSDLADVGNLECGFQTLQGQSPKLTRGCRCVAEILASYVGTDQGRGQNQLF